MIDMQERLLDRQAHKEYTAAFLAVQKGIHDDPVVKRGTITAHQLGNATYARLVDVSEKLTPLLLEHGIVAKSSSEGSVVAGLTRFRLILTHISGHVDEHILDLPLDDRGAKSPIQSYGSSWSYGHRIMLCHVFNIVTIEQDLDGNTAKDAETITAAQVKDIEKALEDLGRVTVEQVESFLKWIGAPRLDALTKAQFTKAMTEIKRALNKGKQ